MRIWREFGKRRVARCRESDEGCSRVVDFGVQPPGPQPAKLAARDFQLPAFHLRSRSPYSTPTALLSTLLRQAFTQNFMLATESEKMKALTLRPL